jgi:hypothetical protein
VPDGLPDPGHHRAGERRRPSCGVLHRQAGFTLDVDYYPARGIYLAVTDIEAARQELIGGGVMVSDIWHKSPIDDWKGGWQPNADPQRRDYASFADLADPDGNTWVLREIGYRPGTHPSYDDRGRIR